MNKVKQFYRENKEELVKIGYYALGFTVGALAISNVKNVEIANRVRYAETMDKIAKGLIEEIEAKDEIIKSLTKVIGDTHQ